MPQKSNSYWLLVTLSKDNCKLNFKTDIKIGFHHILSIPPFLNSRMNKDFTTNL